MKENYIYSNGEVIVTDIQDGYVDLKKYEYQDNIEEIFVVENMLEELEKNKVQIKSEIKMYDTHIYKDLFKTFATMGGGSELFALLIVSDSFKLLVSIFLILSFGSALILTKQGEKNSKKTANGYKLKLEYLEQLEEKNKKLLEKLKQNKTKNNIQKLENDKDTKTITYKQKLESIRDDLKIYQSIAMNENKYEKYYNKDALDSKLKNEFTEEEIIKVKQYFKNKKTTI